eukprot:TRINITY_DN15825_c0_g1::TRINITY_DN15825_c0_g1_i1::g.25530::m.25530 TRINITY_DN15825_c0_g1::TRINITY_DN15825_c0_g1_i1::g.25530  ORF type:complete len:614 (+),score=131.48,EGF_2/PF07974.8/1.3e+03,EGF_2/PF07974.8/6.8e+03,EGF_2/PF07974.8/0.0035 TRINITY_DN15825_c0_g1_i1:96-1937(+)
MLKLFAFLTLFALATSLVSTSSTGSYQVEARVSRVYAPNVLFSEKTDREYNALAYSKAVENAFFLTVASSGADEDDDSTTSDTDDCDFDDALSVFGQCAYHKEISDMCQCLKSIPYQLSTSCWEMLEEEYAISAYFYPCDACSIPIHTRDSLSDCRPEDNSNFCSDKECYDTHAQYYSATKDVRKCFYDHGVDYEFIDPIIPDAYNYCEYCMDTDVCDECNEYGEQYVQEMYEAFETQCANILDVSQYTESQNFQTAFARMQSDVKSGYFNDFVELDSAECEQAFINIFAATTYLEKCYADTQGEKFLEYTKYYFPPAGSDDAAAQDNAIALYSSHSGDAYLHEHNQGLTSFDWALIVLGIHQTGPDSQYGLTQPVFIESYLAAEEEYYIIKANVCPSDGVAECSGNGGCHHGVCACTEGYYGASCNVPHPIEYLLTTFQLSTSMEAFTASAQLEFRAGLARLLGVDSSAVSITSITTAASLLPRASVGADGIQVFTRAYVSDASEAQQELDAMSTEDLSSSLHQPIEAFFTQVVDTDQPNPVTDPVDTPTDAKEEGNTDDDGNSNTSVVIGAAVGGAAGAAGIAGVVFYRRRRRNGTGQMGTMRESLMTTIP